VAPKLLGVSFEMTFSCGVLVSFACPVIAKMEEPTPTIYQTILCLFAMILMFTLK